MANGFHVRSAVHLEKKKGAEVEKQKRKSGGRED